MNRIRMIANSMVVSGIAVAEYKNLKNAIEKVMSDIMGEITVSVSVDFEWGWNGKYRPATQIDPEENPEFEAWGEKVTFKPTIATIAKSEIQDQVLEILTKANGEGEDPEVLVKSPYFDRYINETIHRNKWELEDVDVNLPDPGSAISDIEMKLTLIGDAVRVEFSMSHQSLQRIMKKVNDEASDWYQAPERIMDREED